MKQIWLVLIVTAFLAALSAWAHHVIYEQGRADEKASNEQKIAKLHAEQAAEYQKYVAELAALNDKLLKTRRDDDAKLAAALAQSPQALDLWNTVLPPATADWSWADSGLYP